MVTPGEHAHLATVTRGPDADTVHLGSACLADADGKILWSIGNAAAGAHFRSSSKPLQALPVVEGGAADACGLAPADLAIVCGSHEGGPAQVEQVRSLLARCRLDPALLQCGEGLPDNCSGKHAGMLAGCLRAGHDLASYCAWEHPWQVSLRATIADYCGMEPAELRLAGDGCSAPTFFLPLANMARGFARFGREAASAASSAPGRLMAAMLAHPGGHTGEPDVRALPVAGAPPLTKAGANGLFCAALPRAGLGFALKVADGTGLIRWPVFLRCLEKSGLVPSSELQPLRAALTPKVATRRGAEVGAIVTAF